MTLDVLIATCRPEGILRVERMELPMVENVRYIVSWQLSGNTPVPPALAARDDLEVHRVDSVGLSRNRNDGLSRSRADICLIADDDLRYTPGRLKAVIEAFSARPSMDVAAFMYDGSYSKQYPSIESPLIPYPKGYYPSSIEIAVRRTPLTSRLRFDERFGLASGVFHVGEEDVFLLSGHHLGLDMRFIPVAITSHEGHTTGLRRISDPRILHGFGAVIFYLHPLTFTLRIPLKALRLARKGQARFLTALVRMYSGALKGATINPRPWKKKQ